jgi:hypothetical protein
LVEFTGGRSARKIFQDLHPERRYPGEVNGSWNWVTKDGRSLWEIAEEFLKNNPEAS